MLSINTNLSSIIAQRSMKQSTNKLNQAIERMTTGAKINHAKDNAANYNIATNMTTKLGALQVAEDNCAMGLDMLATANGTLAQIHDKLQRLRDLAVQSSNGTYGSQSKQAINSEANALVDEIERLYKTAEYNGIKLFDNEQKYELPADAPRAQYDGFIKEVVKRDTSVMTTLASVDPNFDLANGTYSISTPEEMKKLADMTNAGLVSAGDEFVLANDIDLSCYENWTPIGYYLVDNAGQFIEERSFKGVFDGNGFLITNMKIINPETALTALFSNIKTATIKNLGIKDFYISTNHGQCSSVAGMAASNSILENCYVKNGTVINSQKSAAAICTNLSGDITDCYSDITVIADYASGLVDHVMKNGMKIENCFSNSEISGAICSTGLAMSIATGYELIIKNSSVLGFSDLDYIFVYDYTNRDRGSKTIIENCSFSSLYEGVTLAKNASNYELNNVNIINTSLQKINLQIGINSSSYVIGDSGLY